MIRFLINRLPSFVLLLVVTSVIAFALPRMVPGDPAAALAGSDATAEQIEAIRQQLDLGRPFVVQYFDWLGGLVQGDLGTSILSGRPVAELIGDRVESSLELTLVAATLMIVIGGVLGVLAGTKQKNWIAGLLDGIIGLLVATPPHVTGLVMILIMTLVLPYWPISGEASLISDPGYGFQLILLPALALSLPQAAAVARLIQSNMRTVAQMDFVELARAKGVPPRRIITHHILRNSLGNALIVIALRVGELLSGAVVIEAIFARNGLGQLAVAATQSRDYMVVQVIIVGAVAIAALVNMLSEIGLAILDPRIRLDTK
ncbi:ABC transporter permease [Pseudooceanicola spongiae]|uniref:ABC transporter permease subunit n=1 Tax=Pseudooceanicola spongiae TaxID=2613965 RepID=A0A7L9WT15_9RHOB|nr:ABC transporter permease [Pseudooceanicola spongiae]QOL83014.1 ABC transporter permease subunit [Pseudooceanicola spongiae]